MDRYAIILAAGQGKRIKSNLPKVLHKACGKEMVNHVIDTMREAGIDDVNVIIGKGAKLVQDRTSSRNVTYSLQEEQLGTGHAVKCAKAFLDGKSGVVAIFTGDAPLIKASTVKKLIDIHIANNNCATLLTSIVENPTGYGRIVRNDNAVEKIVEHKDCSEDELNITEINAGMYCFDIKNLLDALGKLSNNNAYIGVDVKIGQDTIIYPGNVIEGDTVIGESCVIYPNSRVNNSIIEEGVEIQSSVILDSKIGKNTTVGPFAYIRPESNIGNSVRIGDFVEIKKSTIGDNTKVSHLTYIGDAEVGTSCNFGCGTVVVNYDGKKKHKTKIGNNVFIGCNTNLVAPVEVKDNSYTAAGSTITKEVPEGSLAVARARQKNIDGWVERNNNK